MGWLQPKTNMLSFVHHRLQLLAWLVGGALGRRAQPSHKGANEQTHLAAHALDQVDAGHQCASSCHQVIENDDTVTFVHGAPRDCKSVRTSIPTQAAGNTCMSTINQWTLLRCRTAALSDCALVRLRWREKGIQCTVSLARDHIHGYSLLAVFFAGN